MKKTEHKMRSLALVPAHVKSESPQVKIFAQTLVEQTLAKHSELAGVELATTPLGGKNCVTIVATDTKEIGDKYDMGELGVIKTGKSTVENEADGYDVTLPLQVDGKTIGIISLEFKLEAKESDLLGRAQAIGNELESQVPAKSKLFVVSKYSGG